jgi:hypothetical protein
MPLRTGFQRREIFRNFDLLVYIIMKRIKATLLLIICIGSTALLMNGCKEINPLVLPTHSKAIGDTTYIESPVQNLTPKYVLIEELTGVQCPNCPAGQVILENLAGTENVVPVAYHVGESIFSQDQPVVLNPLQVMTSTDAQTIVSTQSSPFGFPGAGPLAMVDRVLFNNGTSYGPTITAGGLWNFDAGWGGDVTIETTAPNNNAPVNIYLSSAYIAGKINISIGIHYTATQTDSDKVSIFLTEDSIVTAQLLADQSVDTFHVHNHIMRAAVTNALGDIINVPSFVQGRVDTLSYSYIIPPPASGNPAWNISHMHVIAFVHKYQNGNYSVLQAAIASIAH